jgi:hypothetical protein
VCFKFSRHEQNPIRQVKKLIDNALKSRVPGSKYGLLFDIVTTNSTIMSGAPHLLANQIYTYVDEMYSNRPGLKFVFVGITDNDNCRAARDVFCKEDQAGHPKKPFVAIDNNHMYAVYPFDEELTMKMVEQNTKQLLSREAENRKNNNIRLPSPKSPVLEFPSSLTPVVVEAKETPRLPMQPRHTIQKRKLEPMSSSVQQHQQPLNTSVTTTTTTTTTTVLSPLRRLGKFSNKSHMKIFETNYQESSIKPVLPVARPFSAANPLDGSPFILDKAPHRLHQYEPVKTTKKITTVDFSFFLTQSSLLRPAENGGINCSESPDSSKIIDPTTNAATHEVVVTMMESSLPDDESSSQPTINHQIIN